MKMALGQLRLLVKPLQLLLAGFLQLLLFVLSLLQGQRVKIQFGLRKGGEELFHNPLINGIGPDVLTHRDLMLAA